MLGYHLEDKHFRLIKRIPAWGGLVVFVVSFFLVARVVSLKRVLLYGSSSYAEMNMSNSDGILWRTIVLIWGVLLIVAFMVCIPSKRIPVITGLGANTLQVYYIHGLLLHWAKTFVPALVGSILVRKVLFFIILSLTIFLLASKPVSWLMKPILNPLHYFKQLQRIGKDSAILR